MSNVPSRKNKILNKNNFLNWIIGGVIALIITKTFDHFSEFLFSEILNIGGIFVTSISDSTYKEISNGFSEQSTSTVLYFVFLLCIGILEYLYLSAFQKYKYQRNEFKNLLTSIDDSIITFEKSNNVTSDNLQEQDSETLKKQLEKGAQSNDFRFCILIIFFFFAFLSIIFFYGQSSYIRNKTIALTNNIEIVSPYITDVEYKQLKSNFHSIETQSDYNVLVEELKIIADEYTLKLK